jgi:hypothetical protein
MTLSDVPRHQLTVPQAWVDLFWELVQDRCDYVKYLSRIINTSTSTSRVLQVGMLCGGVGLDWIGLLDATGRRFAGRIGLAVCARNRHGSWWWVVRRLA